MFTYMLFENKERVSVKEYRVVGNAHYNFQVAVSVSRHTYMYLEMSFLLVGYDTLKHIFRKHSRKRYLT